MVLLERKHWESAAGAWVLQLPAFEVCPCSCLVEAVACKYAISDAVFVLLLPAAAGVAEADSIVLVVDGQSGLHPSDEEVVAWLQRHHPSKPVVLAVNKCESSTQGPTQVRQHQYCYLSWMCGWCSLEALQERGRWRRQFWYCTRSSPPRCTSCCA